MVFIFTTVNKISNKWPQSHIHKNSESPLWGDRQINCQLWPQKLEGVQVHITTVIEMSNTQLPTIVLLKLSKHFLDP